MMATAIRVLYVDDEQVLLDIAKNFLEQDGTITVYTAESASQAFELLKKQTIDAIISDYQMPEMDGIQFLQSVRKEYPALPFILFTGKGSDEIAIEAFESGADYYVKKVGAPTTQFAVLAHRLKLAFKRRQEAERFRKSEERYRTFIETASEGIVSMDASLRILFVNQKMADMLGYSMTEITGKVITGFMYPEDLADNDIKVKERFSGGTGLYERRFRHRDGSVRWMLVSVTPLKDKDGAFTGSFAMFTDITERKTAEETLRETTEYLQNLIDFASAPIIVWDPDFRITRFNHAFEHLTGRVEQEVIGQPLDILFPKKSIDASLALIKKTLSGEQWESVEIPILASDGAIHTVLWNSANILTAEAELISTIAQGVDITDRKRAESALRQSEQFLDNIVEQIPDMIFVKDAENLRFVRLNKAGEELLGYSRQEMLGKNDYDFFLKTEADFFTGKDRDALRTNQVTVIAEEKIRTRNMGERILHTKKIPLFDEEGKPKYLLGISEDITNRKQAADMIALANRKLTLMNDVTYQYIQNKVTAIRGYAELSKDAKTETERLSFIKKEDQILADMHQLIKNTREYQEIGLIQPRWIPVEQSIRIAASIVSPKESVSIEPALHGLELYSDPLIEKIFVNLIDNAVKHGKTTTRITFSSDKTPDGLILVCEDDGVGISPEIKARLFDRSIGENVGFGLFFIRECLSLSGLTIAETGEPGKGARFEITVPKGMWRMVGADKTGK